MHSKLQSHSSVSYSCLNLYNSPYANVHFLPVTATFNIDGHGYRVLGPRYRISLRGCAEQTLFDIQLESTSYDNNADNSSVITSA